MLVARHIGDAQLFEVVHRGVHGDGVGDVGRAGLVALGRMSEAEQTAFYGKVAKLIGLDPALVARVQAGMTSGSYAQGPLGTSEVCLRAFAGKLRTAIPEARLAKKPAAGWFRA